MALLSVLLGPAVVRSREESPRRVEPDLARALHRSAPDAGLTAIINAVDMRAADSAAAAAPVRVVNRFPEVGSVVVEGSPIAIREVIRQPGIVFAQSNRELTFHTQTAHEATRSFEAEALRVERAGGRPADSSKVRSVERSERASIDGRGVSIAVIDSGIDGTHPMFQDAAGSKVVRNLRVVPCYGVRAVCRPETTEGEAGDGLTLVDVPGNDSDTGSVGGHGTHVASIAAGSPARTSDGRVLRGAAPGAKLIGLSTGAFETLVGAALAAHWVLQHHADPCEGSMPAAACPPIRVVNNSYGTGAGTHDPDGLVERLHRALVDAGVVTVFAAGNAGGDGTEIRTNGYANSTQPGVISVAAYDDMERGSREGTLADFSSRGKRGRGDTYPDVTAPGTYITAACRPTLPLCTTGGDGYPDPNYNTIGGTSMAAPYVAGVAAQLIQADPSLTPAGVETILEATAHKFVAGAPYEADDPFHPGATTSFDKGHGLVDVRAALETATGRNRAARPAECAIPSPAVVDDPGGDANRIGVRGPVTAPPEFDIRGVRYDWDEPTSTLAVALTVGALRPASSLYLLAFTHGGRAYTISISNLGPTTAAALEVTDNGSFYQLDTLGYEVDRATNTIKVLLTPGNVTAANEELAAAGLGTMDTLSSGRVLSGLSAMSKNELVAVRMNDDGADYASAACPLTLGTGLYAPTPPTVAYEPADTRGPVDLTADVTLGDGSSWAAEGLSPADTFMYECTGPNDPTCITYVLDLRPSTGTATLDVTLESDAYGTALDDFDVILYELDGTEVAVSGNPQTVLESFSADVEARLYYLVVQPYTATTESPYKVTATLSAP